jgi:hypothetical protein
VLGGSKQGIERKNKHRKCYIITDGTYITLERLFVIRTINKLVGRDGSVGITTGYGLDGPGIESRWGANRTRPDRPWGPPSHLYNGYRVSFPGVKRPERGVDNPPSSCAEVKERVELYLYSSTWAFVACSRVNFTFTFYD